MCYNIKNNFVRRTAGSKLEKWLGYNEAYNKRTFGGMYEWKQKQQMK